MTYTVRKLSKLAGISVRTLHYYDEIGLLKPSFIHQNGYRYYEERELMMLQQILFFRELEFTLEQIMHMVNAPDFNTLEALASQRKLLRIKKSRIDGLLFTIDKTMESIKKGENMKNDDLYGSFSQKQMEEYKQEAKMRWGNTDAYKQSVKRVKKMSKENMKKIKEEGVDINKNLAQLMDESIDSTYVQTQIERHFRHINKFYNCSYEMYRNLGKMYVEDVRFNETYDSYRPGLAKFIKQAIAYYCDKHQK